jgi:hypothetical protein
MKITTGTIVSILLTLFSTILSIITNIPSTSSDHSSNNIFLSRAVIDKLQNFSKDRQLFAANILHQKIDPNDLVYNISQSSNTNLAKAVILYNDNPNNNSKEIRTILNNINGCTDPYCILRSLWFSPSTMLFNDGFFDKYLNLNNYPKVDTSEIWFTNRSLNLNNYPKVDTSEIWFTNRSLNLENLSQTDVYKEDDNCITLGQSGKCSYNNIANMKANIGTLDKSGFLENFQNDGKRIHSIQNSIEAFVSALNHFFVLFIIAVPNTFLTVFTWYLNKSKQI